MNDSHDNSIVTGEGTHPLASSRGSYSRMPNWEGVINQPTNFFSYVTPPRVAHGVTVSLMGAVFTVAAAAVDMLGYFIYCVASQHKLPTSSETLKFVYIPAMGSLILGGLACAAFTQINFVDLLENENKQWMRGVIRLTVAAMLVFDDFFGLLMDAGFAGSHRLSLIDMCWRSKLTSVALVTFFGALFVYFGGEKRAVESIFQTYEKVEHQVAKQIGSGTDAQEYGLMWVLKNCCSTIFNPKNPLYEGLSQGSSHSNAEETAKNHNQEIGKTISPIHSAV